MNYPGIYLAIALAASAAAGVASFERGPRVDRASQATLCAPADTVPADLARRLTPLGEPARTALVGLAGSQNRAEAMCGLAGLAALGDRRAIPFIVAAFKNPAFREEAYLVARWAGYLAGGPAADLGAAMLVVVEAVADQEVWDAAGDDAIWLMGELDHPTARDRLLIELRLRLRPSTLDAVIHGLARQGDPRAHETIASLGAEAALTKSGNATPEQARRLGEVAFYQLALEPDSVAQGLTYLQSISRRDQEDAAAWAVQTLCARAVRRPARRAAIEEHRRSLVAELDRLGIDWRAEKGSFGCRSS